MNISVIANKHIHQHTCGTNGRLSPNPLENLTLEISQRSSEYNFKIIQFLPFVHTKGSSHKNDGSTQGLITDTFRSTGVAALPAVSIAL